MDFVILTKVRIHSWSDVMDCGFPDFMKTLGNMIKVIPAKAGIHSYSDFMDSGFRRNDEIIILKWTKAGKKIHNS